MAWARLRKPRRPKKPRQGRRHDASWETVSQQRSAIKSKITAVTFADLAVNWETVSQQWNNIRIEPMAPPVKTDASATRTGETQEIEVFTFELTMDQETIQTLADVLFHVSGGDGRGKLIQDIVKALRDVDIKGRGSEITGNLNF